MTLELRDNADKILVSVSLEDLSTLPEAIMTICGHVGLVIESIQARLPVKGEWFGVHGEVK